MRLPTLATTSAQAPSSPVLSEIEVNGRRRQRQVQTGVSAEDCLARVCIVLCLSGASRTARRRLAPTWARRSRGQSNHLEEIIRACNH